MTDPLFQSNPVPFLLGAIVFGALCGLAPFLLARRKRRGKLALVSLLCCIGANIVAGLAFAIPTAVVFLVAIALVRPTDALADELKGMLVAARHDVKDKWVYFHSNIHLKADVPLSQKIELFPNPLQQFFQTKYPVLLAGPSEMYWLTIFTAILESGTHPKDEVNAAIADLQAKYAKSKST